MSCFRTFSVVLILYLVAVQMVSGSSSHFSHCSRLIMILVMVSIHSWKMSCCLTHCFGKVNQAAAWMLSVCLCLQYCCENLSIWDYCCFFAVLLFHLWLLSHRGIHWLLLFSCSEHAHTHTRLTALCLGLPRWAGTRKVKPIWILLEQEIVSGSDISWAICKSAPHSRQITTPAPHHSVFYRLDALPAARPTASKHWRHFSCSECELIMLKSRVM